MRRFVFYLIPALALALFFAVMNGGIYLKNSVGEEDHHFTKYYEKIRSNIKEEQWEQAINNTRTLEKVWKKKIPWIQFSVERAQINGIDISLARLEGYLEAKDKAGALAELYESKRHWDDLGR